MATKICMDVELIAASLLFKCTQPATKAHKRSQARHSQICFATRMPVAESEVSQGSSRYIVQSCHSLAQTHRCSLTQMVAHSQLSLTAGRQTDIPHHSRHYGSWLETRQMGCSWLTLAHQAKLQLLEHPSQKQPEVPEATFAELLKQSLRLHEW